MTVHDEPGLDQLVTLSLPAQSRYIRLARLVGAGLANDLGVDLDGLDDVRLAIGEVCGLATQLGAATIHLRFAILDGTLVIRGDGMSGSGGVVQDSTDDDQIKLARQILDVACSEHELTLDEAGLSFTLSFTHGT